MEKYKATMSYVVSDHEPKTTHEEAAAAAVIKSCRGRKPSNKSNAQKKKKIPQRGMGVAQLERLRIQERFKRMPEMPPLDSPPSIQNNNFHQSHLALPEPIPSVPVMYGPGNYSVPFVVGNGLLGSLEQSRVMYGGGGSGQVLMSNFVGTSKELSSMPKNMHLHHQQQQPWGVFPQQHCDICLKKKRFHGENIGFHGVKEKYPEVSTICYGVPGMMNQENNFNLYGGINGFGTRAARSASNAGQYHNLQNKGAQAVVIHRNGNSMAGSVPREIEFFPGKGVRSTSSKDLEFPAEASVAVNGEASWITPTTHIANAPSNSIDLSLKLSL